MTFIFNVFVFLQIFNFVNARKIQDELNVFENLHKSTWFIGIIILIFFSQLFIIEVGGRAISVSPHVKKHSFMR